MRNSALDLIRCIAIILVICIHSMGMLKTAINPPEINKSCHICVSFFSYRNGSTFICHVKRSITS